MSTDSEKRKREMERREAEKREEERRERIYSQISGKKSEVSALTSKKSELQKEVKNLVGYIDKWHEEKEKFNRDELAKKVVVKNIFEGKAATVLQAKKEKKISIMDSKISATSSIKWGLIRQILTVQKKIDSLNTEIASLYREL